MQEYLELVERVLANGQYTENRTAVDTISAFSQQYKIDVRDSYTLLTTKQMNTYRWDSMCRELEWYLTGAHHIRELTKETNIWDAWADENGNLESAYGRFWRRFPIPHKEARLPGEAWPGTDCPWVSREHAFLVEYSTPADTEAVARDVAKTNLQNQIPDNLDVYPADECVSYDEDTGVYVVKLIVSIQDSATEGQDIHQQISEALHTEVKPYSYSSGSTVPNTDG